MADEREYAVGKGKPPQHSRFKKGQSGNPSGRRKGTKNLATLVKQAIFQRVTVTENGRRKTITKLDAILKPLVNNAASGVTPVKWTAEGLRLTPLSSGSFRS